jgi:hypothetical protein
MTILMLVAGCSETLTRPPADFTDYLQSFGQVFTPQFAPADAADWRAGIPLGFPYPGAMVDAATYGVVTCVDPTKNCANRGLAGPGPGLPIWIVSFVEGVGSNACPAWATIDARTGAFINGTGPPCS